MTNDLEHFDISSGNLNYRVGDEIRDIALPKLLDLYSKYNVKSTFFVLGSFALKYPDSIKMIAERGHEIASHGFSHAVEHGFDVLNSDEQIRHLRSSKYLLEHISGQEVISFRSPALRMNTNMGNSLEKSGFLIDSSICPKRIDSFISYGTKNKINWLNAPSKSYLIKIENIFEKGNSSILEIPISSSVFGFIGSTMRASPYIFEKVKNYIFNNSIKDFKVPAVFLFHPNELLSYRKSVIQRRSKNFLGYLLKDYLRAKIKSKNLGQNCYNLLEKLLIESESRGFKFITMKQYRAQYLKEFKGNPNQKNI